MVLQRYYEERRPMYHTRRRAAQWQHEALVYGHIMIFTGSTKSDMRSYTAIHSQLFISLVHDTGEFND